MDNLTILPVSAINIEKVLSSTKLTDTQKVRYIEKNKEQIKDLAHIQITKSDFIYLMKNRPLIRFRPIRNSFTKRGDKILLAKSLNIEESDINEYIDNIIDNNFDLTNNIELSDIEKVKTYVWRHGKKEQVIAFLEYELRIAKDVIKFLQRTFDYENTGLASYFSRPIHSMDDKTMANIYNAIDKRIKDGVQSGEYSKAESLKTQRWALVKLYQIQNNSKLIRAARAYKNLT